MWSYNLIEYIYCYFIPTFLDLSQCRVTICFPLILEIYTWSVVCFLYQCLFLWIQPFLWIHDQAWWGGHASSFELVLFSNCHSCSLLKYISIFDFLVNAYCMWLLWWLPKNHGLKLLWNGFHWATFAEFLIALLINRFDINGFVTGFGNPDWAKTHDPAARTSSVVSALIDGGATCVGKTVIDEMAYRSD